MISVSNLSKSFGDRSLFEGASFQLNAGERYGLVGANGAGKTTLLNILSGVEDPTEGTVATPKSARLGVLRQDQFLYEEEDILSVALMGNPELWEAMHQKALVLGEALGHKEAMVRNYSGLSLIYQIRGEPDKAKTMREKSLYWR